MSQKRIVNNVLTLEAEVVRVKKKNLDGASLITPDTVAKEIFARKTKTFDEQFAVAKAEIAIILHGSDAGSIAIAFLSSIQKIFKLSFYSFFS